MYDDYQEHSSKISSKTKLNVMKIAILDTHKLLTELLTSAIPELFKPEKVEVRAFNDISTFLSSYYGYRPSILFLDIFIGTDSGQTVLNQLKEAHYNECHVIMLTTISTPAIIRECLENGAAGYLSKDASFEEIKDSVVSALRGEQYIAKNLRPQIIKSYFQKESLAIKLTNREKEVLREICKGLTMKEIASNLNISIHTVKYHYQNLLDKFSLKRSKELIVFAVQNGYIN